MSEKIYARLLRLYPSGFRSEYEDEVLQLIRDRLRDEAGFFKRILLWWDLGTDILVGLPQAYRNSYAEPEVVPLSPIAAGIPSFKVLNKEPLGRGSILVGGVVSLSAIAAFGFVLSQPIAYLPLPGSNAKMSPIESVLQSLNRTTDQRSAVGSHLDVAKSSSTGAGDSQAQSSAIEREKLPNLDANANVIANGLNAAVRNGSRDSQFATGHGHNSLLPGDAAAGCVLASVSQTAQPKPELLLFHPSGSLPSYEVATVKPIKPEVAIGMVKLPPVVFLSPLSIRRYIMNAYGAIYPPQVVGGPDWLNKEAYDINGKVPDDLESAFQKMAPEERIDQTRMMEQCLLANRFHLKAHFETRVLPVYELVPARSGLKITEVPAPPTRKPGDPPMRTSSRDDVLPGTVMSTVNSDGLRVLSGRAIKMQLLARVIVGDIGDRPIVDHTGFTGYFDVHDLTWAPLDDALAASGPDAPSIQGALKEKLGLTIVSARDPIEVLVIDSIERPTPN